MANVDINNPSAKERVSVMWQLINDCVEDMHPASPSNYKTNLKKFLLHVAWHEGKFLLTRIQDPRTSGGVPGPGRSFFQFEPPRAKEAIDYAKQKEPDKKWLTMIAIRSGQSPEALRDSSVDLTFTTTWPASNLIEQLLINNDLFGVYLARIAFAKIPESIPENNNGHAEYWAKYWKRVFNPGENRTELVNRFAEEANKADSYLS